MSGVTTSDLQRFVERGMVAQEAVDAALGIASIAPKVTEKSLRGSKQPNKTEAEFGRILQARKNKREITNYGYELYTLMLGDRCRYTPDFAVVTLDEKVEFYEVKGSFIFSRALVKPRTAATIFPQHRFFIAQKLKGDWRIEQIAHRNLS